MVSRNEFFIAVLLLAVAINTKKNDVHVSWVYNGREDLTSASSVGLLCRELSVALRLQNKTGLHEIFTGIHEQVRNGIKYSCYPYMATIPQDEAGDIACVLYQKNIREADDFDGMDAKKSALPHNNAAAQSILDVQILDDEDGVEYVFDYDAGRYEKNTMLGFQKLFMKVVAAIVSNSNTEGYDFEHLKRDVCDKKDLIQKIKDIFVKKK